MLVPAGSGLFVLFFIGVLALGIASTVWRVSTARRMAERAGLDVGDATAMALLAEDGLPATYLASNLHPTSPTPVGQDPAERLRRLRALLDEGLISQAEHDERRRAIIDEV